jgi:hypothetical protein
VSTKLRVGTCRKIGLPNYGSVGAECSLEIELDSALIADPAALQARIAATQAIVARAVADELARQTGELEASRADAPPRNRPAPAPREIPLEPLPRNGQGQPRKERIEWGGRGDNGAAVAPPQQQRGRPGLWHRLCATQKTNPRAKGLVDHVTAWGRARGYPPRIKDWDHGQVEAAEAEVVCFLGGEC